MRAHRPMWHYYLDTSKARCSTGPGPGAVRYGSARRARCRVLGSRASGMASGGRSARGGFAAVALALPDRFRQHTPVGGGGGGAGRAQEVPGGGGVHGSGSCRFCHETHPYQHSPSEQKN